MHKPQKYFDVLVIFFRLMQLQNLGQAVEHPE